MTDRIRWTGDNIEDVYDFATSETAASGAYVFPGHRVTFVSSPMVNDYLILNGLNGDEYDVAVGDWIVRRGPGDYVAERESAE